MLPFRFYSHLYEEKDIKNLKKFKKVEDVDQTLVKTRINKLECADFFIKDKEQKFDLKAIVYCDHLDKYVQLKKFDEETKVYSCRVIDPAQESSEILEDIHQDKLTKFITIQVRRVTDQE